MDLELLATNLSPVISGRSSFPERWNQDLLSAAEAIIATGYVSIESTEHLIEQAKMNDSLKMTLLVGMAMQEGLTAGQKLALNKLNGFLTARGNASGVRFVTNFAFHGKTSYFKSGEGTEIAYVGSSNLSGVLPISSLSKRNYEIDVRAKGPETVSEVLDFLLNLEANSSTAFDEIKNEIKIVKGTNEAIFGAESTSFVSADEYLALKLNHVSSKPIQIKISTAGGSSLNDYFGYRKDKKGKMIRRDWYEVGLIVRKEDRTSSVDYPLYEEFFVVTDDGFEFVGKTSGGDSKNFSSKGNNRVFGRWIKGRLEDAGVLQRGELVTDATLELYGNHFLTLTKTSVLKQEPETGRKLRVFLLSFERLQSQK